MIFIGHADGLSVFDDAWVPVSIPFDPPITGAVYALEYAEDSLYVSGADGVLRIYNTTTWEALPVLVTPVSTARVYEMAVSGNQRYVAFVHFSRTVVYDLSTGSTIYNTAFFPHHASVTFSADDEYVIFTDRNSGASTIVNLPGGSSSFGPSGLKSVAISPDRSSILALAFTSARELDPVTLDTLRTVSVMSTDTYATNAGVAWAENGQRAVVTSQFEAEKAIVIDAVTWTVIATIEALVGTTETGTAKISPNGETVVVVSPVAPYLFAFDAGTGSPITVPGMSSGCYASLLVNLEPPIVIAESFWTSRVRTLEIV